MGIESGTENIDNDAEKNPLTPEEQLAQEKAGKDKAAERQERSAERSKEESDLVSSAEESRSPLEVETGEVAYDEIFTSIEARGGTVAEVMDFVDKNLTQAEKIDFGNVMMDFTGIAMKKIKEKFGVGPSAQEASNVMSQITANSINHFLNVYYLSPPSKEDLSQQQRANAELNEEANQEANNGMTENQSASMGKFGELLEDFAEQNRDRLQPEAKQRVDSYRAQAKEQKANTTEESKYEGIVEEMYANDIIKNINTLQSRSVDIKIESTDGTVLKTAEDVKGAIQHKDNTLDELVVDQAGSEDRLNNTKIGLGQLSGSNDYKGSADDIDDVLDELARMRAQDGNSDTSEK